VAHVYLSSTYSDLRKQREAIYKLLRRIGHDVIAVEDYVASDERPIERCIADVKSSDVYLGLIARRYGYVPPGQELSITELEYRAAREAGIPCLFFLLHDDARWPLEFIDRDPLRVKTFRDTLNLPAALFRTTEELVGMVAAAVTEWQRTNAVEPVMSPDAFKDLPKGPDIFMSYAHEDIECARTLAKRLEQEGWSVFWDRKVPIGMTWDEIVEAALDEAKCVVVLWSQASVKSEWVRTEAMEGVDRGILVPALIANTKIPLRFRPLQAANLVGWNPQSADQSGTQDLVSAVGRVAAKSMRPSLDA